MSKRASAYQHSMLMVCAAVSVCVSLRHDIVLMQMRFGGNIGVHAINRTSAAPLSNPTQQQLLQQPGLGALGGQGMGLGALSGINNPLAGLPGAPRPAVRPPNWQRAQALAAQAQAQAQQQVGPLLKTRLLTIADSRGHANTDAALTASHKVKAVAECSIQAI